MAKGKNTKIEYQYRDEDNYHVYNECVVAGIISDEQKAIIMGCLDEGTYFIPSQVGLPETRFDSVTEADHCWFELDGFTTTDEAATCDASVSSLVKAFTEAKGHWNDTLFGAPTVFGCETMLAALM